jgi:hypothetical protein
MGKLMVDVVKAELRVIYVYCTPDMLDEIEQYEPEQIPLTGSYNLPNEYRIKLDSRHDFDAVAARLMSLGMTATRKAQDERDGG